MKPYSLLLLGLLPADVHAQVPSALLRVGDILPGGDEVATINYTAVNQSGGFAVHVNANSTLEKTSHIWGSLGAGAGQLLRSEQMIGNYDQERLYGSIELSSDSIAYSAQCSEPATSSFFLSSVWIDDGVHAIEDEPSAIPGLDWASCIRAGITQNGIPYFIGTTTPDAIGPRTGLFFGANQTPLLLGRQMLPGLPLPLSSSALVFSFRISAMGTNSIVVVDLETTSMTDKAITLNGEGLHLAGTLVREGNIVPAALGGVGSEQWDEFRRVGVNENGNYFVAGRTNGPPWSQGFLLKDGAFFLRPGDQVDGLPLVGNPITATMNEAGTLAYLWSVDTGAGGVQTALCVDQQVLLLRGDPVDIDGDGQLDAGTAIQGFEGLDDLSLGPEGRVYFIADVAVGTQGDVVTGYFSIDTGLGSNYCVALPNSTGLPARMSAVGDSEASTNSVTLSARSMPPGQFGYFLNSLTQDFIPSTQGNLCLGGSIGRYRDSVFLSDAAGSGSLALDLSLTPTPGGDVAVLAGETWHYQAWFRDLNPGPVSNFTDGLSIVFD